MASLGLIEKSLSSAEYDVKAAQDMLKDNENQVALDFLKNAKGTIQEAIKDLKQIDKTLK